MLAEFEIRDKVSEFVKMAAIGPVRGFYPTATAKYVNAPVTNVFPYLMDLTKSEELSLVWELRCPAIYCNNVLTFSKSDVDYEAECPRCGEEFIIQESDFFPRFDVNDSYKKYIRKDSDNTKKKHVLSLRS